MEERKLNSNSSCFLIKDERLKGDWRGTPIHSFLKEEGFEWAKGCKSIEGIDWMFINIHSKVYATGRPGIGYAPVVGDHAITFDEFVTIYNIYKKYEGFSTLKMTAQEQKEFEEYLASFEEKHAKKEKEKEI